MAGSIPITLPETVIAYYRNHSIFSLDQWFGERVAIREKFSRGWERGKLGLTIKPDGGPPDNFTLQQQGRLELRILGPSPEKCNQAYALIEQDVKSFQRGPVAQSALLQMLVLETGPTYLHDPDLDLDLYLFFMNAAVSTENLIA